MGFEITTNSVNCTTLHDLSQTYVPQMYLDDLGQIPSNEVLNNYLNSIEQTAVGDPALYNKATLDTHTPSTTPADFSILRTTADGFLASYILDDFTDRHVVLGKNSSIVNSSLVNGSLSLALFPSFFNSLLNPIFYIASLSNSNLPFVLLSGGYIACPARNSSQGATLTSTQYTTTTSTGRGQYARMTTGTALGHQVGEDGDGDNPRHPRNFNQLQSAHYNELTETELRFLFNAIFQNQVERMSEEEVINFITRFHVFHRLSNLYQVKKSSAVLHTDNWESEYLFLRNLNNVTRPKFFLKKRTAQHPKFSPLDGYVLIHDDKMQRLISRHVNGETIHRESLLSRQSSRSSIASSRGSERSVRSRDSRGGSFHFHTTASAAPVTGAVAGAAAGAQASQAQIQQQAQGQTQHQSSALQTWLPILMGIAGAILLGQKFSVNIPHRRNKTNQLRIQGQNRGRQDFLDDITQANQNRPFGGLGSKRIPVPALENEISSLPLEEENNAAFKAGQNEGYRMQQRDHQRTYPQHKTRINEISRANRSPNQVQFNTGSGFSLNHQALIGILFELGSVLLLGRNRKKNKEKENKK